MKSTRFSASCQVSKCSRSSACSCCMSARPRAQHAKGGRLLGFDQISRNPKANGFSQIESPAISQISGKLTSPSLTSSSHQQANASAPKHEAPKQLGVIACRIPYTLRSNSFLGSGAGDGAFRQVFECLELLPSARLLLLQCI